MSQEMGKAVQAQCRREWKYRASDSSIKASCLSSAECMSLKDITIKNALTIYFMAEQQGEDYKIHNSRMDLESDGFATRSYRQTPKQKASPSQSNHTQKEQRSRRYSYKTQLKLQENSALERHCNKAQFGDTLKSLNFDQQKCKVPKSSPTPKQSLQLQILSQRLVQKDSEIARLCKEVAEQRQQIFFHSDLKGRLELSDQAKIRVQEDLQALQKQLAQSKAELRALKNQLMQVKIKLHEQSSASQRLSRQNQALSLTVKRLESQLEEISLKQETTFHQKQAEQIKQELQPVAPQADYRDFRFLSLQQEQLLSKLKLCQSHCEGLSQQVREARIRQAELLLELKFQKSLNLQNKTAWVTLRQENAHLKKQNNSLLQKVQLMEQALNQSELKKIRLEADCVFANSLSAKLSAELRSAAGRLEDCEMDRLREQRQRSEIEQNLKEAKRKLREQQVQSLRAQQLVQPYSPVKTRELSESRKSRLSRSQVLLHTVYQEPLAPLLFLQPCDKELAQLRERNRALKNEVQRLAQQGIGLAAKSRFSGIQNQRLREDIANIKRELLLSDVSQKKNSHAEQRENNFTLQLQNVTLSLEVQSKLRREIQALTLELQELRAAQHIQKQKQAEKRQALQKQVQGKKLMHNRAVQTSEGKTSKSVKESQNFAARSVSQMAKELDLCNQQLDSLKRRLQSAQEQNEKLTSQMQQALQSKRTQQAEFDACLNYIRSLESNIQEQEGELRVLQDLRNQELGRLDRLRMSEADSREYAAGINKQLQLAEKESRFLGSRVRELTQQKYRRQQDWTAIQQTYLYKVGVYQRYLLELNNTLNTHGLARILESQGSLGLQLGGLRERLEKGLLESEQQLLKNRQAAGRINLNISTSPQVILNQNQWLKIRVAQLERDCSLRSHQLQEYEGGINRLMGQLQEALVREQAQQQQARQLLSQLAANKQQLQLMKVSLLQCQSSKLEQQSKATKTQQHTLMGVDPSQWDSLMARLNQYLVDKKELNGLYQRVEQLTGQVKAAETSLQVRDALLQQAKWQNNKCREQIQSLRSSFQIPSEQDSPEPKLRGSQQDKLTYLNQELLNFRAKLNSARKSLQESEEERCSLLASAELQRKEMQALRKRVDLLEINNEGLKRVIVGSEEDEDQEGSLNQQMRGLMQYVSQLQLEEEFKTWLILNLNRYRKTCEKQIRELEENCHQLQKAVEQSRRLHQDLAPQVQLEKSPQQSPTSHRNEQQQQDIDLQSCERCERLNGQLVQLRETLEQSQKQYVQSLQEKEEEIGNLNNQLKRLRSDYNSKSIKLQRLEQGLRNRERDSSFQKSSREGSIRCSQDEHALEEELVRSKTELSSDSHTEKDQHSSSVLI